MMVIRLDNFGYISRSREIPVVLSFFWGASKYVKIFKTIVGRCPSRVLFFCLAPPTILTLKQAQKCMRSGFQKLLWVRGVSTRAASHARFMGARAHHHRPVNANVLKHGSSLERGLSCLSACMLRVFQSWLFLGVIRKRFEFRQLTASCDNWTSSLLSSMPFDF